MKHFIGIDMGTQSMKGLLFSPDGIIIAEASSEYLPSYPYPGWAECDPSLWLGALREIIADLKRQANINSTDIGTIAFACIDGSLLPVDNDCMPIDNCIIWLDNRTGSQYQQLQSKISDKEALPITGSVIFPFLDITKMMWFKQNKPEIYNKARYFLEVTPFFVGYLTGEPVSAYCGASITQLYDVIKKEWSQRLFDVAGLDIGKMCRVSHGFDVAGNVRPRIAQELGLSPSTMVAVGGSDHSVAMLGSGLDAPGKVADISGTCTTVATYLEKPVFDDRGIMYTHISTFGNYWTLEQGSLVTGANLRWFKDVIARCEYSEMDTAAAAVPPGSNGLLFLPYLQGKVTPQPNANARGVFFGLTMNHDVSHMARAVYEGCTFSICDCVRRINELGISTDIIISSGGGTKSRLWNQMKADALGCPVQVMKATNAAAIGAGILAGVAQKLFPTPESAIGIYVQKGDYYEPNPDVKGYYDDAYSFYLECAESFEHEFNHYQL